MRELKNLLLFAVAGVGAVASSLLGGWDSLLKCLTVLMVIDYITGVATALVFHRSNKTLGGGASSKECFKGIVKKISILCLVAMAVCVDNISGTHYIRSVTIIFFIGNEGISVLENVGLMGIPYPAFLKKALEEIKKVECKEGE